MKIKEMRSAQVCALYGIMCRRPEYGGYTI